MPLSVRRVVLLMLVGGLVGLSLSLVIHAFQHFAFFPIVFRLGICIAVGTVLMSIVWGLTHVLNPSGSIVLGSRRRFPAWRSFLGSRIRWLTAPHHRPADESAESTVVDWRSERDTETDSDRVCFTLTGPKSMKAGLRYVVDVWAHRAEERAEVIKRVERAVDSQDLYVKSKDAATVRRGTILTVRLEIPTFVVPDAEESIEWNGDVSNVTFLVEVPPDAVFGPHVGTARVYANGIHLARLHFSLVVGPHESPVEEYNIRDRRARRAFASYASEDRNDVLGRIQGMLKILPDYDIFLDVASLRSGEHWQQRLSREIASRDVFHLFWSIAASRSPWVEREWKTALDVLGVDAIDPVPLQPPDVAPPPRQLADHIHFNDWILAFRRING